MVKIYHNPRCSKSRQTLALLRDNGVEPEIVLYLEDKLSQADIKVLLGKLEFTTARDLMRRGEADYKALDLKNESREDKLLDAMVAYPKLIERPIVVKKDRAVLGRPPENALKLL